MLTIDTHITDEKIVPEVEADMHQHIHKQNNVLFAKALQLETEK